MATKAIGFTSPATTTERVYDGIGDEFYYGYRLIITYDNDGKEIYSYKPLTLADFLEPEEGDLLLQGTLHHNDTGVLTSIFRHLYKDDPNTTVFSDLKIMWGIEGLSQPAPDVMVIPNVKDSDKPRGVFKVTEEGTKPRFILEVVSPRYRQPDRNEKVAVYEQAGVEEYIIIDSWLKEDQVSYEVLGYRLQDGIYTQIQPDERGWVYSATNDVWIGMTETRDSFFVVAGQSGEHILPAEERAKIAEEQAKTAAEARLAAEQQVEAMKAELARLRTATTQAKPGDSE